MKWIKLFEDFKQNNEEGTLITIDDIIKCIKKRGVIYATIVKEYPDNDPKDPITPVDIDEDGLITVEINNKEYYVDLDGVEKIEY
jgi:hypothetical protein